MRLIVHPGVRKSLIHPEIYGHFSEHLGRCIYGGVFVGKDSPIPNVNGMRTDVVTALKRIHLPALRWPGGCFADEYHWRDGVGPLSSRVKMINSHWGGVVEDNSFGAHEFFELCRQLGCEPYVNGNLGSGTVREMQDWVEYITSPDVSPMADLRRANGQDAPWALKYFGVGNENWGCGGNMTAAFYADNYRRYQTYVRNYGDNHIYKIACGAGTSIKNPGCDWTETLMREAGRMMNGLSLHYYTVPYDNWQHKGSATEFSRADYMDTVARAQFMDRLCEMHGAVMDRYDPEKRVGLIVDEWGTWYDVEPGTNPGFLYQQNTMRDAMVAALTLNIFNRHSDRVHMANLAQLANVLQSLVLTDGERMLLTPTYHVFDLFKAHQGATLLGSMSDTDELSSDGMRFPRVSHSASVNAEGRVHITLCNLSPDEAAPVSLRIDGQTMALEGAALLTGDMHAHNTFESPDAVRPRALEGVSVRAADGGTEISLTLPPVACASLTFA